MLKIHLGDQTDSKLLLGTYLTTETPGKFKWQPGVLTTAVTQGRWILIEDIDLAPNDVLAVLVPLLETRWLQVPARGEKHKAKEGFAVLATRKTSKKVKFGGHLSVGNNLWTRLALDSPDSTELAQIIEFRYPSLQTKLEFMLSVFNSINSEILTMGGSIPSLSLRDLMRWCSRVNSFCNSIDESLWLESFYRESLDCFTGMIANFETRSQLSRKIGSFLCLNDTRIEYYIEHYKPSVKFDQERELIIGRSVLAKESSNSHAPTTFALTSVCASNLERVSVAVQMNEPVLLVGETGTGKTTMIQSIASQLGKKLSVINMSQQSDSTDLLGGFKPVDLTWLATNLKQTFDNLFAKTFSIKSNGPFLDSILKSFKNKKWSQFVIGLQNAVQMAGKVYQHQVKVQSTATKKKIKIIDSSVFIEWENFSVAVSQFQMQIQPNSAKFLFSFLEGTLVNAIKNGHWILLDEINLATSETLECLSGLLQDSEGSILLLERGDTQTISRHKDFRIFGCMNPANDSGKKNLPAGLRSRFSEFWIDSPDSNRDDLLMIVESYCRPFVPHTPAGLQVLNDVTDFYISCRRMVDAKVLFDGADRPVHFSLRTLTRAITFAAQISDSYGVRRSLYEGCFMTFMTGLNNSSYQQVEGVLLKYILNTVHKPQNLIKQIPEKPRDTSKDYVLLDCFWLERGPADIPSDVESTFVRTKSVEMNLRNLTRACLSRKYPILIQGPTSAGKTSMIEYLAKLTGNKFIRVNNHEHTDLQEYIGSYATNNDGALVFQEGVLVEALRQGHWIVLDELNLAPTDVLEALNRLLDDNRELYLAEKQEVILPHPNFMLFATQNPAGQYGGRKQLSRAFRNRFLELHVTDIPEDELITIIEKRCLIPPSYAKKLVSVFKRVTMTRDATKIFEGKLSFITLRDLFRWAMRKANGYEELALHGYMLIAERIRKESDKVFIQKILEEELKVKIDPEVAYSNLFQEIIVQFSEIGKHIEIALGSIVWTSQLKKLFVLVYSAMLHHEQVLLIGETGCGKTTICQIMSILFERQLSIINAHQNSETSDFLGSQRPSRCREESHQKLPQFIAAAATENSVEFDYKSLTDPDYAYSVIAKLTPYLNLELLSEIGKLFTKSQALFEWQDGPLIQTMRSGDFFLLDEISLAEDAVLERLNSVLETGRQITLIEKPGEEELLPIKAADSFQFFATMNPGGDYGKKELSPALRNRFSEIWVPQISDTADLITIVEKKMQNLENSHEWAQKLVDFLDWFALKLNRPRESIISIRDVLGWASFIESCKIDSTIAFYHGGCMVFADGIGVNPLFGLQKDSQQLAGECRKKLADLSKASLESIQSRTIVLTLEKFGVEPFYIPVGSEPKSSSRFHFHAPTTAENTFRVLRALQLSKPILLEGSPGAGKTSLISSIAAESSHHLVRINLSEQTDLMDLFGSDLPVEGGASGEFAWRDGPFLQAMQAGHWVLLDELNLASQQVLEGLNACLDHRAEVYIPDLDKRFPCHPEFRVFAAQNPQTQGGGRKGLPRSFLNRFSLVYIEELIEEDLLVICNSMYPDIEKETVSKIIKFNQQVKHHTMESKTFGFQGSPWEFNLRDVLRWLDLVSNSGASPETYISTLYISRMRTENDRKKMLELASTFFDENLILKQHGHIISPKQLLIGVNGFRRSTSRNITRDSISTDHLHLLHSHLGLLQSLMTCVTSNTLGILIGPSACGKSSLVRLLASLCGERLEEISMNPGVDSLEILGSFEQADQQRFSQKVVSEFGKVIDALQVKAFRTGMFDLLQKLEELFKSLKSQSLGEQLLNELIEYLGPHVSTNVLVNLTSLVEEFKLQISTHSQGRFEWVDSALINALENGYWIVIDNANLCSSSVLDRLNSVLEVGGSLALTERGLLDGKIRMIKPHENFRIFMTLDPIHGEISRAMRNRGMEIFVQLPVMSPFDNARLSENETKKLSKSNGLDSSEHEMLIGSDVMISRDFPGIYPDNITGKMLTNFSSLCKRLLDGYLLHHFTQGRTDLKYGPVAYPDCIVALDDYLSATTRVYKYLESEADGCYSLALLNNADLSTAVKLQIAVFSKDSPHQKIRDEIKSKRDAIESGASRLL